MDDLKDAVGVVFCVVIDLPEPISYGLHSVGGDELGEVRCTEDEVVLLGVVLVEAVWYGDVELIACLAAGVLGDQKSEFSVLCAALGPANRYQREDN